MPKEINPWAMYPRKTSPSPLPEALKMEVTTKAYACDRIHCGLVFNDRRSTWSSARAASDSWMRPRIRS